MKNKTLNVFYNNLPVGRLIETPEKLLAFEYDAEWLRDGFSISPFHLPLEKQVFIAGREPFEGNFGVFNDSLPDGWGRLLIDRMLAKRQIDPASVSLLDRLAITGTTGMGALEYKPVESLGDDSLQDIDVFAIEAKRILADKDSKDLEKMVRGSGGSNGARPKTFLPDPDGGAEWLVKLPASNDPDTIGKLEFKYMQAAKSAELTVPSFKLFNGKYFGAQRFDRKPNGEKVFMISASALLNSSHRAPTLDYNDLMRLTFELTRDFSEVEKMFRLMCFNVFSHNRDDHSKNFSFLYDGGKWKVSPVYDLVYNTGLGGEHATMVDGNGRNPTKENILSVAQKCGLSQRRAKEILAGAESAVKKAKLLKE